MAMCSERLSQAQALEIFCRFAEQATNIDFLFPEVSESTEILLKNGAKLIAHCDSRANYDYSIYGYHYSGDDVYEILRVVMSDGLRR